MPGGQFDTDAISSHAQATARCVNETEGALQQLVSSGNQLAGVWTTGGGQAFQQQLAEFTRAAQAMTVTLQQIGETVQAVAGQYVEQEAMIASRFSSGIRG
jgi:WXG100 family type VII secretion target